MSRGRRSFRVLLSVALAALAVPVGVAVAGPAAALGISGTISDQQSCEQAGGSWDPVSPECDFGGAVTIDSGKTLTTAVETFFSGGVTISGSLVVDEYTLFAGDVVNDGTLTLRDSSRAREGFTNNGLIAVEGPSGKMEFYPDGPLVNARTGRITVDGLLDLETYAGVTNGGSITVTCRGRVGGSKAGSVSGNPIAYADCTPPAVTVEQASTQADPTTSRDVTYNATFDRDIDTTSFDVTKVQTSDPGAGVTAVANSDKRTVQITVSAAAAGPVSVSLLAGAAKSTAGVASAASTSTNNIVTVNPATLAVSPTSTSIVSGGSQTFSVVGKDSAQHVLSVTGATLAISPDGSCSSTDLSCTATKSGPHTVTATYTPTTGTPATGTASLTVTSGQVATVKITPSSGSMTAGGSTSYVVTGTDAGGNPVDVSAATLSIGPDGSCSGRTCTATTAGPHLVTATLSPTAKATAVLDVVAGAPTRLMLDPHPVVIKVGKKVRFRSYLADTYGNRVRDVTRSTTFGLSGPGVCRRSGPTCRPTSVGRHVVIATRQGLEVAVIVTATKRRP